MKSSSNCIYLKPNELVGTISSEYRYRIFMRLATLLDNPSSVAVVVDEGVIPLNRFISHFGLPTDWKTDMKSLIELYLDDFVQWYRNNYSFSEDLQPVRLSEVVFGPLLTNPGKIWGIGLNYADHAADLDESTPAIYPGSFMRPVTTIIGHNQTIQLPDLSQRTTGEGELGVIIGKKSKNIDRSNWLDAVAGFTTINDMTAEDILRLNPRYLTLAKSFDTYFSIGPVLITKDEFTTEQIMELEVCTVLNHQIHAKNQVKNMRYPPDFLVAFHSEVMTLLPGDIISTGTPRAVHINSGDTVSCYISGFYSLDNLVIR